MLIKLYMILAALAFLGCGVLYLEHRGATQELAKLQKSSTALIAKAAAEVERETALHAADVEANQEKLNATQAANAALSDALDKRVRDFDAYRRSHPAVQNSAGGPVAASSGECGAQSCADLAVQLAERGNDLARSNGELVAALQAAQRDRDALTGK